MPASDLAVNLGLLAVSIVLLYFGAEWLVTGSARVARAMRIRPLVIGLTVVAFATSAPELVVGIVASLRGVQDVSVGNVIGANVANVGLIIGLSALLRPLMVAKATWRKEVPMCIAVQVILLIFCLGGRIARWEGAILIVLLLAFVIFMIRTARVTETMHLPDEVEGALPPMRKNVGQVMAGVVLLGGGGYVLVESATTVAAAAGLTHLTIGVTLVAFLTTVPELATSVVAARRGEGDISVGNAVGSVLFNSAFVLGTAASIHPIDVSPRTRYVAMPIMIAMLLVLTPFMRSQFRINRIEGAVLLAGYVGFLVWSIVTGGQG